MGSVPVRCPSVENPSEPKSQREIDRKSELEKALSSKHNGAASRSQRKCPTLIHFDLMHAFFSSLWSSDLLLLHSSRRIYGPHPHARHCFQGFDMF